MGADGLWWASRTSTPLAATLRLVRWVRLPLAPASLMTDKQGPRRLAWGLVVSLNNAVMPPFADQISKITFCAYWESSSRQSPQLSAAEVRARNDYKYPKCLRWSHDLIFLGRFSSSFLLEVKRFRCVSQWHRDKNTTSKSSTGKLIAYGING